MQQVDLMTFLLEQYKQQLPDVADTGIVNHVVDDFVAFARNYLAKVNQPINMSYAGTGIALRLQQGQTVHFAEQQKGGPRMRDEGIPITRPLTMPGRHSIVDTDGVAI